jgi:hypothetical protein
MPLDPAKIDQLVGQLSYLTERLEHMELKTRGDAVNPTQRGVADSPLPKDNRPDAPYASPGGGNKAPAPGTSLKNFRAQQAAQAAKGAKKDAAGGYAPIEPHQAGFVPEARADAARRKR